MMINDAILEELKVDLEEDLTTTFKKELAKKAEDGRVHTIEDINDINDMLTKILNSNLRQMRNLDPEHPKYLPLNILIIGDAGSGKSSIIDDWAESQNLTNVKFNGSQLNPDLVQGVGHATKKTNPETGEEMDYADYLNFQVFDKLDPKDPDTRGAILFIDELNRSYSDARAALLDMITSHQIADNNSPTNRRRLNRWIMTVAAVNPPDKAHKGAELLDLAMLTRFYIFDWKPNVKMTRKYLVNSIDNQMKRAEMNLKTGKDSMGNPYTEDDYNDDIRVFQGQQQIAKAILTSDFAYDSGDTLKDAQKNQKAVLNARTIEEAIRLSDGTVDDFLRILPGACGISKDSDIFAKIKLQLTSGVDAGRSKKLADDTRSAYDKLMAFEDEIL